MDTKFSELIEARRSVRKYAKAEITKDEMAEIAFPRRRFSCPSSRLESPPKSISRTPASPSPRC